MEATVKVGALIQARMTSERCPGKMLRSLGHHLLLGQVLENLSRSSSLTNQQPSDPASHVDQAESNWSICVATSSEPTDDSIAEYCKEHGWDCARGDLNRVAERLLNAATDRGWDVFVRISGDSPLLDYRLVDQAVELFHANEVDLVSNVFPRRFPKGQSVEVIRVAAMQDAIEKFESPEDFEHVTPYFYRHADQFRIESLQHTSDMSSVQMSVDTEYDFQITQSICQGISNPVSSYPWHVLLRLANEFHMQAMGLAI